MFTSVPVGNSQRRISGTKRIHIYNFDIAKLTSMEIVPVYMPQAMYGWAQVLIFRLFSKMIALGFLVYDTTAGIVVDVPITGYSGPCPHYGPPIMT